MLTPTPDPVAIPDLLIAQSEHHDLTPDKLIYDAAAGLSACGHAQAGTDKTYTRCMMPHIKA